MVLNVKPGELCPLLGLELKGGTLNHRAALGLRSLALKWEDWWNLTLRRVKHEDGSMSRCSGELGTLLAELPTKSEPQNPLSENAGHMTQ